MPSPFRQALRILQWAALFLVLAVTINLAVHGWLGAILEVAALFLALAIAVNLAVYGWLGALGTWSSKEAHAGDRLVHLLIAGTFTVLAAGVWYSLFRGSPVRVSWNPSRVRTSENAPPRTPRVNDLANGIERYDW